MTRGDAAISRQIDAEVARFRRDALAVRLPLFDRARYWLYYLLLAHRGHQVPSAERDAVYADGFWKRGYDRACGRINRRLAAIPPRSAVAVPTFANSDLSIGDLQQLMRSNVPFLVQGGADRLPARAWTLDYLEKAVGSCQVPINEAADLPAVDTTRPTKSNHYYAFRTGTVAEVAQSIRNGGQARITTAEDVMHHDGQRLRRELDLPFWEQVSGWDRNRRHWLRSRLMVGRIVGAQLMLQPQNAFTLWHAEPGDNFFVLLQGNKTWTMAHPYYTAALQPRVKTTTNYHGSNIDARESDAVQRQRGFAGYPAVPKVVVPMQAGDMLRVPNHWWHTVVTAPGHYTVAATIRSNSPPNRTGFGYGILRLFDRQYHALAKAFVTDGRINDRHIGYPRPTRAGERGKDTRRG